MLRILRVTMALAIALGGIGWAICQLFTYGSTVATVAGLALLMVVASVVMPSDMLEED